MLLKALTATFFSQRSKLAKEQQNGSPLAGAIGGKGFQAVTLSNLNADARADGKHYPESDAGHHEENAVGLVCRSQHILAQMPNHEGIGNTHQYNAQLPHNDGQGKHKGLFNFGFVRGIKAFQEVQK